MTSSSGTADESQPNIERIVRKCGLPKTAFFALCLTSEAILFVYDRTSAYIGLEAFSYGLILWLIVRSCIKRNGESEATALRTRSSGTRLYLRTAVVVATLLFVAYQTSWGEQLILRSHAEALVQRLSSAVGLGYGDSALPNFIVFVLIPGTLLFALGTKPIELGLTAWRKGSWYALMGAFILPAIFAGFWFARGHATIGLLILILVRNLLSNGFSEEFLMRGMTMSHLRAYFSKDWALVLQATLFGLLHFGQPQGNWVVALAYVIALNAPMGFFLGLIALRSSSVVLPGLIHMTLDTLKDLVM